MKIEFKRIIVLTLVFVMMSFPVNAYYNVSEWATEEIQKAGENNLIPNGFEEISFSKSINREEFAKVCVVLYEQITGNYAVMPEINPFIDTDSTVVTKAYELGIVNGVSKVEFEPESDVSREQAAAMLSRTIEKSGGKTIYFEPKLFADDNAISDWAKNSVYKMREMGLISGKGGNMFVPFDGMTVEETLAISYRIYENLTSKEENVTSQSGLLAKIPVISFGGEQISEETETSASISVKGVTIDDYRLYIENVQAAYSTVDNIFPDSFIIANNGVNTINVTYENGLLKVTLTKGVN